MANQAQLEVLKQGVDVWNTQRSLNRYERIYQYAQSTGIDLKTAISEVVNLDEIDLQEADLQRANLRNVNFSDVNLNGANFQEAELEYANFSRAKLNNTNFVHASLSSANLASAELREADLSEAFLIQTNLSGAILNRARLSHTFLAETIFAFNDLSEILEIEKVFHRLPSSVDLATISISKGKIPEIFLRGCGLSDLQIQQAKLANPGLDPEQVTEITYKIHQLYLGQGIQYYSCFISYNNKDQEFSQNLHDDLQNNGVRCWFAPEDMKIGDQIRPRIDQEIRLRDKLLVILSENSVQSEWVGDEVEAALEEEKESGRLVLFPIRLDDAVMDMRDDWAAKVKRRRHIGDFSNWKDDGSYRKAFERLLQDLKAGGE
jgi:uncharacterized protein YjbI with pentapeptide repeats